MTGRPKKWQRLGYQDENQYRAAIAARHATKKAALLATETRCSANRILALLWDRAEFDKPQVTITREQIMAATNLTLPTVRNALAELKAEGSLKAIRNRLGGRGNPVTWRLCVAGSNASPSDQELDDRKAARDRDAAWRFLRDKFGPVRALELMDERDE